ncbi:hypothetical protein [Micromonospora sp. NPDC005087]
MSGALTVSSTPIDREKYVDSCAYAFVDDRRLDEYDYRRDPGPI